MYIYEEDFCLSRAQDETLWAKFDFSFEIDNVYR